MKLRTTLWPVGLSLLAACAATSTAGDGVVAAVVLSEQLIQAEGRQPPFAFAIAYDGSRIQPHMSYAVGARIEDGGGLLFINDPRYAVLTRGAPTHVDRVLRAVAAARP